MAFTFSTLTTNDLALIRFSVDSRVDDKDLPNGIIESLLADACGIISRSITTSYSAMNTADQAEYKRAVIAKIVELAIPAIRNEVSEQILDIGSKWQGEKVEDRTEIFKNLFDASIKALVINGHGSTDNTSDFTPAFEIVTP